METDIQRVLVTGGAGFVGTQLCLALAATPGYTYRALDFPGPRLEALESEVGDTVGGSLLDPGVLENALGGCAAIIHLVVAHEHASRKAHQEVTIGGARRVVEAAGNAGVPRLLFMSSIKAARDYTGLYGTSKRKAEAIIRESDLDWTIFRPGLLYGPGELRLSAIAKRLKKWFVFPMPGRGDYPIFPLRTADLAAALMRSLTTPESVRKIYELGSDEAVPLARIVRMIGTRIDRTRPFVRLPLWLCKWMGIVLETVSRHPVLFSEQIRAMQVPVVPPDVKPAKEDLGFSTPPFADGLDDLVKTWDF